MLNCFARPKEVKDVPKSGTLWSGALSVVSVQEGSLLMTKGMVYDAVMKEANSEGLVAWDRRFQLLTRREC